MSPEYDTLNNVSRKDRRQIYWMFEGKEVFMKIIYSEPVVYFKNHRGEITEVFYGKDWTEDKISLCRRENGPWNLIHPFYEREKRERILLSKIESPKKTVLRGEKKYRGKHRSENKGAGINSFFRKLRGKR